MEIVTYSVIGAGDRANKLTEFIRRSPTRARLVAVCDPNEVRLEKLADEFGVATENRFSDWTEMMQRERLSDAVIISTPDHLHYHPSMEALKRGYHILLEKPIAQTLQQCLDIQQLAHEKGLLVGVCHVMRYFPSYKRVKQIIKETGIGEIISINHREPVGIDRMTHCFVRGIWNNAEQSNPMVLAKTCHDLDILVWLTEDKAREVSSFGSLKWFRSENAPQGSAQRCIDCSIEYQCRFSAIDLYLRRGQWLRHFDSNNHEYIRQQLATSDYGLCVYHCQNNVVDNQMVLMLMKRGAIINMAMDIFTNDDQRTTHIMGTEGEIKATGTGFEYINFKSGKVLTEDYSHLSGSGSFHNGADIEIVADFTLSIATSEYDSMKTNIDSSIESHRIAFIAEEKRKLCDN